MLKKSNEKRGCLGNLIWIPISIIVMFCIAGYGMSQGINVPGILSGVFNVTSKGEHANTTDTENYLGNLFQSLNRRKQGPVLLKSVEESQILSGILHCLLKTIS